MPKTYAKVGPRSRSKRTRRALYKSKGHMWSGLVNNMTHGAIFRNKIINKNNNIFSNNNRKRKEKINNPNQQKKNNIINRNIDIRNTLLIDYFNKYPLIDANEYYSFKENVIKFVTSRNERINKFSRNISSVKLTPTQK